MLQKYQYDKIKNAFWDYNVVPENVYRIITGENPGDGYFTKEYLFKALLERLSWYEIIDFFGIEFIKDNLTINIISKIHNTTIKHHYEFVRKFLLGETLSSSGWSDENRKRLESSVLSHRWHSS